MIGNEPTRQDVMERANDSAARATLNAQAQGRMASLLKSPAAAAFLGICERLLWSLTNCGDIPSVRIGRAVRYDPSDLAAYVARQKRGLHK